MKLKMIFFILLLSIAYGCKKDSSEVDSTEVQKSLIKQVQIVKNPYSVSNMRKALSSLLMKDIQLLANNKPQYAHGKVMYSSNSQQMTINPTLTVAESLTLTENGINATHYYIKFMPRHDADYALLKMDSTLVIYPFSLDSETSEYSGSYRDPSVPAGVPTYQYAAVAVNYNLPAVPYVKLEDLYLPDEQNLNNLVTLKGTGNSSYTVSVETLVNESICSNDEIKEYMEPEVGEEDECGGGYGGGSGEGGGGESGNEWRPNGRITVYDEIRGTTIGVEGIKVRARRWFTTYIGITDANGYYSVDGTYTRPANYWLDFERYDFSVSNPLGFPHEMNGPKIKAAWNVNLEGYDKYVSSIFRAAFHYYHKDIQGLHRPPQNSFWARQLKIAAIPDFATSTTNPVRTWFGIGDLIHINGLGATTEYIYSTTIHELAHAAHWDRSNLSFALSASTVSESWATGVEWLLTKMEYPSHYGTYWSANTNYRNVVMDLIDTPSDISYFINPGNLNNYEFSAPNDQVQGYTIVEIQNAMINSATTWTEWKNNIKNIHNNATENQNVDALFDAWLNY